MIPLVGIWMNNQYKYECSCSFWSICLKFRKPSSTLKSMRWRSSRPGYVQRPKYVSTPESVPCAWYSAKKLKVHITASLKHKSIHAWQTSGIKQLKIQISLLQNDSCLFFFSFFFVILVYRWLGWEFEVLLLFLLVSLLCNQREMILWTVKKMITNFFSYILDSITLHNLSSD